MSIVTTLLVGAIIFAIFYYLLKEEKYPGKLPPGPRGLPFFGSVLSLGLRAYVTLGDWVQYYGPIFRVKFFHYKLVVISDPKLAREAYNNPALTGRPDFRLFNALAEGNHGIINSTGREWVDIRRFTLRNLRDFGFGKQAQQNLALEEVRETVDWFKTTEGKPTLLDATFDLPTVNSLWTIMTGKRFSREDPSLKDFLSKSNEVFEKLSGNPLAIFFPDLCAKFPNLTGWNAINDNLRGFKKFVSEPVVEQKKSYSPAEEPQDFVEACMQEISKTTDPSSPFYKAVGEHNKNVLVLDLFGAGSGTTSNTLSFALLYLSAQPEIQKKLQAEIDKVVGLSRQPTLDDRKDMPYAEAFMYEVLRKSSIVPFGVFHEATETTTVGGYTIPKGSWIAVNQYFVHYDPKIWGDPENFRPERFLSPDGKSAIKHEALIPFSVGKRICIGEQIAKDSFFLFLTAIMQKFSIKFDPNSDVPTDEIPNPLFRLAPKFNVIVTDRTV